MAFRSLTSSCRHAPIGVALSTAVAACVGTSAFAQSQIVAWGPNTSGQTSVPSNLGTVVRIAGGGKHSMALTAQGVVKCWGDNLDFGPCPGCPTDLDGTGEVDTSDLALLLLLFD